MSTVETTNLKNPSSATNNIVLNSDGSVGGDLATTLASKVDYALPVNAQTGTTYTFVAADAEKLTTASNAAAVTLTIPPQSSVTWSDNTVLRVVNYGAGAVTIDGGSGVTVTNTSSTIAQYGAAVAIRTGSDAWTVVPFGGGDVPSATVSSPSATGQYTDSGITYDYYRFTASGTLTVDTAGLADVLICGGGAGGSGGSGGNYAGAGGDAAVAFIGQVFLTTGALTVTVGAGGAGGSTAVATWGTHGRRGNQSRLGSHRAGQGSPFTSSSINGQDGLGGAGSGRTGIASSITGSSVTYSVGGDGNANSNAGTANRGNGGNGPVATTANGGNGGSGVVIVRVKV